MRTSPRKLSWERSPEAIEALRHPDTRARFFARAIVGASFECWPRAGGIRFPFRDWSIEVKRAAWFYAHKTLPPATSQVRAMCGVDRCVNPAHLLCQTEEERFWGHVRKTDDRGFALPATACWEWQSGFVRGYGAFYIGHKGAMRAHRYAWIATNGPIPKGLIVCHKCDNPKCVRPEHLFLGTDKDNNQDMIRKGRAGWQRAKAREQRT